MSSESDFIYGSEECYTALIVLYTCNILVKSFHRESPSLCRLPFEFDFLLLTVTF